MKWKIKPSWIEKEYDQVSHVYSMQLNYWRHWKKLVWSKHIRISSPSGKEKTIKMLLAAFDTENNKKTFKNLKAYHVMNVSGLKEILLVPGKIKCSQCKKRIGDDEVSSWSPKSPPGEAVLLCEKCQELNRQINKLKE